MKNDDFWDHKKRKSVKSNCKYEYDYMTFIKIR